MAAPRSIVGAFIARAESELENQRAPKWPSPKWRHDPAGFCRDVLGMALSPQQVEICNALARHPRVAVRAARQLGKSEIAGALGLWFYCSFVGAQVLCTAPTMAQVETAVWPVIRARAAGAKLPLGAPAMKAATGMHSDDPPYRTIRGKTGEDVRGTRGTAQFFIIDEASDVSDQVIEGLLGSLAGGGDSRVLLISNPTRTAGYFADCFDGRQHSALWQQIHLSALESPNVTAGRIVIPGLATREWVDTHKFNYGEDSPFYQVYVLGNFVASEQGRVVPYDLIVAAKARHEVAQAKGVLHIGVDPAGPGSDGDETAICARRGPKVLALRTYRGLDTAMIWETIRSALHEFRVPKEQPIVTLDAGGAVGEPLARKLAGIAADAKGDHGFTFVGVRADRKAVRNPNMYVRVRDELWANLATWLRDGGALPPDDKLVGELQLPMWERNREGLASVEAKEKTRKALGRSPDRCDALALAVWARDRQREIQAVAAKDAPGIDPYEYAPRADDPYAAWNRHDPEG